MELFTAVRESALVYPVILATHLACIAAFGGMIMFTNVRMLGYSLGGQTAWDVVSSLRPWKQIGFVVMVTCGILLGGAKADTYSQNPYFWTKMALLLCVLIHAIVYHSSVYYNKAVLEAPVMSKRVKTAASISLILWLGIVCMGRLIAYYEPPKTTSPPRVAVR
jgi:hypothetical protein